MLRRAVFIFAQELLGHSLSRVTLTYDRATRARTFYYESKIKKGSGQLAVGIRLLNWNNYENIIVVFVSIGRWGRGPKRMVQE